MRPRASVVMPYFNNGAHLAAAVESYLRQTESEIEIILLDDGSTDGSSEVAHSFGDARIIHRRLAANVGISRAYNAALELARTNVTIFAGADDIAEPDRVARTLAVLPTAQEDVLVVCDVSVIDGAGRARDEVYGFPDHVSERTVLIETLKRNYFLGAALAIRSSARFALDSGLPAGDDFDLAIRFLLAGAQWRRIGAPLVQYRVHGSNYSNGYGRMKQGADMVLGKYDSRWLSEHLRSKGHEAGEVELALGVMALFLGRLDEADCRLTAVGRRDDWPERLQFEQAFYLGITRFLQDRMDDSRRLLQLSRSIRAEDPAALNNVGVLEALAARDARAGLRFVAEAAARQPGYQDASWNLAALERGDLDSLRVTRRVLSPVILHGAGYRLQEGLPGARS